MDTTAVLESIAQMFPGLPESLIEQQLVTFDALLCVSDPAQRPAAAQMLRDAAAAVQDPAGRERLLRAAGAVAAGEPCAFTPEGLSARQAAVAASQAPAPLLPNDAVSAEDEDGSDEDDYMEEAPPQLPHLPVRHFFPGLVVRAARDFADAQACAVCSDDLLKLISCEPTDGGVILNLYVRTVRLTAGDPGHDAIIENAGNAWLQPVPSIGCLEDLWEAIDQELSAADEDEEMDDDDIERIETVRAEVEACEAWLLRDGERGPAPQCRSGALAAKIFGRDHHLAAWIRLLFAGVAVALPES